MRRIFAIIGCLGIYMMTYAGTVPDIDTKEQEITVRGGVKAGAAFLNFLKKAAPDAVSGLNPGGSVGGFVCIDFTKTWGLRPELNLNYKQNDFSWTSNSGRFRSMGIEIPIYVTAGWDIYDGHRIFIGFGPYTEFSYSADWETGNRKIDLLKLNGEGEPMIQDSQSGFGAMLGYEFKCGLGIELHYRICYFNILQPNTSHGVSLYPQTIGFGIAYAFGGRR